MAYKIMTIVSLVLTIGMMITIYFEDRLLRQSITANAFYIGEIVKYLEGNARGGN